MTVGNVTRTSFTIGGEGTRPQGPEEGDFMLNKNTGTCYEVLRSRRSPSDPRKFNIVQVRLPMDAVRETDEGVWCYTYAK